MKLSAFLLDVEGVLVADKRYTAVDSAAEFISKVRAAGCPLRLITNNTTDDRTTLIDKLTRAGFDFTLEELHTCTAAAVDRLRALGARRCLVLGNEALQRIVADAGFELADDSRQKLIYEKQDLLAPLLPGMVNPPHDMVDGATEKDYYQGRVTGAGEPLKDAVEGSATWP